jgi:hypothetical protein
MIDSKHWNKVEECELSAPSANVLDDLIHAFIAILGNFQIDWYPKWTLSINTDYDALRSTISISPELYQVDEDGFDFNSTFLTMYPDNYKPIKLSKIPKPKSFY